jgi:trypsin-like peptidase
MTGTLTIRWRGRLGVMLLCLNGVLSSSALAQDLPFSELTPLLHQVAVYGDHDHRLNEADFAASVGESKQTIHDRYAATGTITCGNYEGTAELAVRNDTIVTAAHMFYDGFSCNPSGPADKCVFSYTKSSGASRTIKVNRMLDIGFKCPGTPDPRTDWAVLKLESPADGVTPYQLEARLPKGSDDGSRVVYAAPYQAKPKPAKGFSVVFVAHSMDFYIKDASNRKILPKHFQICEVRNVDSVFEPVYYTGDCDSAPGSSGGGILDGNHENPTLIGIYSSGWETEKQAQQAIDRGALDKGDYNANSWAGSFIPVAGNFLRAIEAAAGR